MIDDGSLTDGELKYAQRINARSQVHAWIKYDLGMAAKLTLKPEQVNQLLDRLLGPAT